ncbi:hypothetical protein [Pectinatus sottacetonis]|uniref:hypothetical protein n=1 Tax=Pectinatus sottacetonis TaxID=1002795 RepID=UPI001E338977|nr:hypothetical protein [Pectinatus sottacetonis]
MSGKLGIISSMRILSGILLAVELAGVIWILGFYFLYTSNAVAQLSVSWLIFIGMILPFNWPGAIICAFLTMLLPTDAVLVATTAIFTILILLVNRAVWSPNPQNYVYLVRAMKFEIAKSILMMLAGCFISLVDTNGQEVITYLIVAVYEIGAAGNIYFFYRLLVKMNSMDYREVFQTDTKTPYGQ